MSVGERWFQYDLAGNLVDLANVTAAVHERLMPMFDGINGVIAVIGKANAQRDFVLYTPQEFKQALEERFRQDLKEPTDEVMGFILNDTDLIADQSMMVICPVTPSGYLAMRQICIERKRGTYSLRTFSIQAGMWKHEYGNIIPWFSYDHESQERWDLGVIDIARNLSDEKVASAFKVKSPTPKAIPGILARALGEK